MDTENLWIGDKVFIKGLKKSGTWEGLNKQGKALIKIQGEIHQVDLNDLSEFEEAEKEDKALTELKNELASENKTKAFKADGANINSIDLHIEKLAPHLTHQMPQMILNHQLLCTKVFLDDAVLQRKMMVNIVHGKGNGTLKKEVLTLIKSFPEIHKTYDKHDGGVTEVWLSY